MRVPIFETEMIDVKRRLFAGVVLAGALLMAGCNSGGGGSGADATSPTDPAKLSGEITVLTNRTDLVQDGTMKKYAAEFNKIYPKVTVKFQGITDYEGEVKIRMNSDELRRRPARSRSVVAKTDYPKFFAPLGTADRAVQEVPLHRLRHRRRQGLRHRQLRQRQRLRLQQGRLEAGRRHRLADDARAVPRRPRRRSRPRPTRPRTTRTTRTAGR